MVKGRPRRKSLVASPTKNGINGLAKKSPKKQNFVTKPDSEEEIETAQLTQKINSPPKKKVAEQNVDGSSNDESASESENSSDADTAPALVTSSLKVGNDEESGGSEDDDDEVEEQKINPSEDVDDDDELEGKEKSSDLEISKIHVCNISLTTKEADLRKFFEKCGPITSIQMKGVPIGIPNTPRKVAAEQKMYQGYAAFIIFKNRAGADKAVKLNGEILCDHHLRITLYNRKQENDRNKSIFVKNCGSFFTHEDIWKTFEEFGRIHCVHIPTDKFSNTTLGIAIVQFEEVEAANRAISKGAIQFGMRIVTIQPQTEDKRKRKLDDSSEEQTSKRMRIYQEIDEDARNKTLHVRNLPTTVKAADLKKYFEKYGKVQNIKLKQIDLFDGIKEIEVIKPKLLELEAFIEFGDEGIAESAYNSIKSKAIVYEDKILSVNVCNKMKEFKNREIKVFNCGGKEPLKKLLESCGPITNIKTMDNGTIVTFLRADSAGAALKMNGVYLGDEQLRISINNQHDKRQNTSKEKFGNSQINSGNTNFNNSKFGGGFQKNRNNLGGKFISNPMKRKKFMDQSS